MTLGTTERESFRRKAKGILTVADVMIAQLALLNMPSTHLVEIFEINPQSTQVPQTIPELLRRIGHFSVDKEDHSMREIFSLEPAAQIMEMDNPNRQDMMNVLLNINLILPIRSIFELLKSYCYLTNQTPLFTSQSWYRVSSILRNAFSHDYILDIWPTKTETREQRIQRLLPKAKWKGINITKSMLGKVLSKKDIWVTDLKQLTAVMVEFAYTLK